MSIKIKGTIASPGIRIGKAYIYKTTEAIIPKYKIKEKEVQSEIDRYHQSLEKTRDEIKSIQEQIAQSLSNDMADIFTSHLMVLEDPLITEKAVTTIRSEKRNVEWVINDITLELIKSLTTIEDDYLRERIIDISDINKRLINNLQKRATSSLKNIKDQVILFSRDLTPSDTAMMDKNTILAFVTDKGGRTSHTAIMARAMEIPALVGAINATSQVRDGDTVIVDSLHGYVIVNPTPAEIKEYRRYIEDLKLLDLELAKMTHLPSQTIDDVEIFIYGNVEIPEEMAIIKDHGAQGIGLYRSEFLFLDRSLPNEDLQYEEYRKVAEFFNPMPVTIRTLDVGGDKIYSYSQGYKERNPFLGCRAIRFSLENDDIFRTQIRAILRSSVHGNVKMMFPMITAVEELIRCREITMECMDDLRKKNLPFVESIPIGIMIEVPSALINADRLSAYSDFFSVGTNDLIQYTLAVDRISEKIAYLYNPMNLSILRLLRDIVKTSREHNIPLSICGEMAGEPRYIMPLIGLGFTDFSMSSAYIQQIKRIIRSVTRSECEELVERFLEMEKTEDIESLLLNVLREKFSWLTL